MAASNGSIGESRPMESLASESANEADGGGDVGHECRAFAERSQPCVNGSRDFVFCMEGTVASFAAVPSFFCVILVPVAPRNASIFDRRLNVDARGLSGIGVIFSFVFFFVEELLEGTLERVAEVLGGVAHGGEGEFGVGCGTAETDGDGDVEAGGGTCRPGRSW